MSVHAEAEQALHVASVKIALQLNDDSQPLLGLESLSNLLLVQVAMAVQMEEDEQAVHVASATAEIDSQSYDDSQPFVGSRSLSNFPLVQEEIVEQVEEEEQAVQVVSTTADIE